MNDPGGAATCGLSTSPCIFMSTDILVRGGQGGVHKALIFSKVMDPALKSEGGKGKVTSSGGP